MPTVRYKAPGGKVKKVKTSYTPAGKKKAKKLAKSLGGKVVYAKPKKSSGKGKRV
tara:strand:+ start:299 stop:463 length:165 start_codon:yes stop_codon:yes gene_type:complete